MPSSLGAEAQAMSVALGFVEWATLFLQELIHGSFDLRGAPAVMQERPPVCYRTVLNLLGVFLICVGCVSDFSVCSRFVNHAPFPVPLSTFQFSNFSSLLPKRLLWAGPRLETAPNLRGATLALHPVDFNTVQEKSTDLVRCPY